MLKAYGIKVHYDEVLKSTQVIIPGRKYHSDLNENAVLIEVRSLCALNNLSKDTIDYLQALFAENDVNLPLEWVTGTHWDGKDRINQLIQSVHVSEECVSLQDQFITLWLIQSVAPIDHAEQTPNQDELAKFENVLILQGDQGVKKPLGLLSYYPPNYNNIHTQVGTWM